MTKDAVQSNSGGLRRSSGNVVLDRADSKAVRRGGSCSSSLVRAPSPSFALVTVRLVLLLQAVLFIRSHHRKTVLCCTVDASRAANAHTVPSKRDVAVGSPALLPAPARPVFSVARTFTQEKNQSPFRFEGPIAAHHSAPNCPLCPHPMQQPHLRDPLRAQVISRRVIGRDRD